MATEAAGPTARCDRDPSIKTKDKVPLRASVGDRLGAPLRPGPARPGRDKPVAPGSPLGWSNPAGWPNVVSRRVVRVRRRVAMTPRCTRISATQPHARPVSGYPTRATGRSRTSATRSATDGAWEIRIEAWRRPTSATAKAGTRHAGNSPRGTRAGVILETILWLGPSRATRYRRAPTPGHHSGRLEAGLPPRTSPRGDIRPSQLVPALASDA